MSTIITADGGNISSDRYVEIISGVGGAAAFPTRQLILRLFTNNEAFPTNSVVTFSSPEDLLTYLNGDSTAEEYKQAVYYFGYISKAIRTPKQLSIARWAEVNTSAQVFGSKAATLDQLKTYTTATLDVTLNGTTYNATAIDLSTAASFADVATALQGKISALDASLSAATVTYNSASGGFDVDTNGDADGALTFASATAGFLSDIGLDSTAVFSSGISEQTLTELMTSSTNLSNNFGSLAFVQDLSLTEIEEVATWNKGQNFAYMYCEKSTKANSQSYFDTLKGYGGLAVTLYDDSVTDEYPWLHPAAETAAIDPSKPNAFPNYMFAPDSVLSAVVTTDSEADTYDARRMNYMGRTQEAGQTRTWYQRGVLMGGDTDATTMSVYMGEAWLKAELKSQFLNMFNALPGITPDIAGRSYINLYLDAAVAQALPDGGNGMISVGKQLTTTQQAYITQVSGDEDAWKQVQSEGYWYTVNFFSTVAESGVTEWTAEYTLIYATAEKVRKVSGTHILI
ncbi:tail sheath [Vibrio phage vB_VpP_BT-1011]|uniref:DUF3383 domain-containing protein n=1 Tax=Vibrio phage vB_VpP_BT-1011 TaxID=2799672 RepID=A0A8F2XXD4_9CAUD|nr:tail sheath [Vibrio phage vB_VpP_BT-1011]QWX10200.1 hypothetical protein vBVpPBT1011_0001 [Vibrio phage vB_VpP_BT-1011]